MKKQRAVFCGIQTIGDVIRYLERISNQFGKDTPIEFRDSTKPALAIVEEIEGSDDCRIPPSIIVRVQ